MNVAAVWLYFWISQNLLNTYSEQYLTCIISVSLSPLTGGVCVCVCVCVCIRAAYVITEKNGVRLHIISHLFAFVIR